LGLKEALYGLAFVWRERADLRPELAARLWSILPDPATWPIERGEIAALRLVLGISRSDMVAQRDVERLLRAIGAFLTRDVCVQTDTQSLFLLIWNVAALHYERYELQSFRDAIPTAAIETLVGILEDRVVRRCSDEERIAQCALAGVLCFVAPERRKTLERILMPLVPGATWLRQEALKQSFVPSFFALQGLVMLSSKETVFAPWVCLGLLAKSEMYQDVGPSIRHLLQWINRISADHSPTTED
jgi:hypothetical protein